MATVPQPLVNQGSPVDGGGVAAPPGGGPSGPPPMPTPAFISPVTAPQGRQAYLIDPLVMDRPVRFTVDAASRMVSRGQLQQVLPIVFQTFMNPAFMAEIAKVGLTVDPGEVVRLTQDATGMSKAYRLVRPLTPQEQQTRQQPAPETVAELQKAQMEAQTRLQMGQMKSQTDIQVAQIEAMIENKEIDEASGLKIMELFQRENSDAAKQPDPMMQQMELQAEIQKKQAELQALERKYAIEAQRDQQKLGMESQKMQLEGQRDRQKLGMDMMKLRMSAAMANQRPNVAAQRTKSEKPS